MKKLLSITFVILGILSINAQEKGKFRVGLDLGYVFENEGGALFSIEPKYNITDNSNIGLRLGIAASIGISDADSNASILGTYDYYFNSQNSSTSPFLGAGLGYFILGDIGGGGPGGVAINLGEQFGALVRGGVEWGKLRIALEYNIIPKSDLEIGESTKNSYLGASIGFYVGGGKWKN
jgi:outer membrane protein W